MFVKDCFDTPFFSMKSSEPMLALSGIPQTVTPGENVSFSLHICSSSSTISLKHVQVEIIGVEHTIVAKWSASTPSSRTFTVLNTEVPLDKLISSQETIVPLSIQFPSMVYDPSKLLYCSMPPTIGSCKQTANSMTGISIQYYLKVRIPGFAGITQREVVVVPKETGFNIDRFVDLSGAPLNRRYSSTTKLCENFFRTTPKNQASLSGGALFKAEGEALFNLSFAYSPVAPCSVSYKLYQVHYSNPCGMGQVLDETNTIQMRKIKVLTKEVSDYTWNKETGVLSFSYLAGNDQVPNFISKTTAVSYLFEICVKFKRGSAKLAVPLILGDNPTPPPAYHF